MTQYFFFWAVKIDPGLKWSKTPVVGHSGCNIPQSSPSRTPTFMAEPANIASTVYLAAFNRCRLRFNPLVLAGLLGS